MPDNDHGPDGGDRTRRLLALVVDEAADADALLGRCRSALDSEFGVDHPTIQVESPSRVETARLDGDDPGRISFDADM